MKTLSKEEKKAVAADIFKRYNTAKKVAVTSDGMAFITDESENAVLNHSKKNRHNKELEITRFTRDGIIAGSVKEVKEVKEVKDAKVTKDTKEVKAATGKGKPETGKKVEPPKAEA